MSDIKKGDKVKILSCDSDIKEHLNKVFSVIRVHEGSMYPIEIDTREDYDIPSIYSRGELEVVELTQPEQVKQESPIDVLIAESYRQADIALKGRNPELASQYIDLINKLNREEV